MESLRLQGRACSEVHWQLQMFCWPKEDETGMDDKFDNNRCVDVGQHLQIKVVGKSQTCLFCRIKQKKSIDACPDLHPEDCLFKVPKTTFCSLGCGE